MTDAELTPDDLARDLADDLDELTTLGWMARCHTSRALAAEAEVRQLRELLRCALPYVPDHPRPETPLAMLRAEIAAVVTDR